MEDKLIRDRIDVRPVRYVHIRSGSTICEECAPPRVRARDA